jgi:hypothetical protein
VEACTLDRSCQDLARKIETSRCNGLNTTIVLPNRDGSVAGVDQGARWY